MPRNLSRFSVEKQDHVVDHGSVFGLTLSENARRLASLDEIVETGTFRHFPWHVVVARANGEDSLDDVERFPHCADVGVRPEIPGSVVLKLARDIHARKRLANRDLDVRIRLVITQSDVESRAIFLDQVRFENQRMSFRRDNDRLEVGDLVDEVPRLRARVVILRVIATHTRPEPLCLADVKNLSVGAFPEVNPWPIGKMRQF